MEQQKDDKQTSKFSPVDVLQTQHQLDPIPLGKGGQGAVYRTKNLDVAVKLIPNAAGLFDKWEASDPVWKERIKQFEFLRILPLEDIRIAKPLTYLSPPFCGYTMRLLRGMEPLSQLIVNTSRDYVETGGLRRRLKLLAESAHTITRLHSIPLIYGDLSPTNIYIPAHQDSGQIWLLDADNLRFQASAASTFYTPRYGAPEVINGTSFSNTYTDAYSFGVIAFEVLTLLHPFYGEMYVNSNDDWELTTPVSSFEELVDKGKIPWIEDPLDQRNHTEKGINRQYVLSKHMFALFQELFDAGGQNRTSRPSVSRWINILRQAADMTVQCGNCKSTFYYSIFDNCPFCGAQKQAILYFETIQERKEYSLESNGERISTPIPSIFWRVCREWGNSFILGRHIAYPISVNENDTPFLKFVIEGEYLTIQSLSELQLLVRLGAEKTQKELNQTTPATVHSKTLSSGIELMIKESNELVTTIQVHFRGRK